MSMMDWAKREVEIACANEREDKDNGEDLSCWERYMDDFA